MKSFFPLVLFIALVSSLAASAGTPAFSACEDRISDLLESYVRVAYSLPDSASMVVIVDSMPSSSNRGRYVESRLLEYGASVTFELNGRSESVHFEVVARPDKAAETCLIETTREVE